MTNEINTKKVIVRFPPSPTGKPHIGNIRTLLFNYLYAKKHGGEIVMRFEDTDTERSKKEFEQDALDTLKELGLHFDHGPFRQSERNEQYVDALNKLIEKDLAYVGEERSDGSGERVIRFKNPNKIVSFVDSIKGEIKIDTTSFGDFVIARSVKSPLYHLTVVVDDMDMKVSHVIRGEDHVTSTPRQVLLIEALGGDIPIYAHLPLIVGEDKKKLGKRHGAVSWSEFKKMGYLPESIINYLALLGWNPGGGDDQEIFSKEELINKFSIEQVNNSPATFSYTKLDDINKHWLQKIKKEDFRKGVLEFIPENIRVDFIENKNKANKIIDIVIKERISKYSEVADMALDNEFFYYFNIPKIKTDDIKFKDDDYDKTISLLSKSIEKLKQVSEDNWEISYLKELILPFARENGTGSVLHPIRTILSGAKKSPDPFTLMYILGKEESLKRLKLYN